MKVYIFDLDGTLTETLTSIAYSVNGTLEEMKLPTISREQCRSFVGYGARTLMERSLQAVGDEGASRIDEAMQIYQRIFGENCTYQVAPYDGIKEMLEALKEQGIKLAVLSNKPHDQTVGVVDTFFAKDLFDHVQGQMEGFPKKPEPDGIYYILDKFGFEKEDCVYVGDSEVDIATGLGAGALTVGVNWGFRSEEELRQAGATHIVSAPEELLKFSK